MKYTKNELAILAQIEQMEKRVHTKPLVFWFERLVPTLRMLAKSPNFEVFRDSYLDTLMEMFNVSAETAKLIKAEYNFNKLI